MKELFDFIKKSPTSAHTVNTVKEILIENGYTELSEKNPEAYSDGGRHFVIKGGSSLIAFRSRLSGGFMICATHSDNPSLYVKGSVETFGAYSRLTTEKYGSSVLYSWLDRPLSVAGNVGVRSAGGVDFRLVDLKRDIAVIPSVAIHMNRNVNDSLKLNPAVDMLPIISAGDSRKSFRTIIAEELGVSREEIISSDLYLYNNDEPRLFGAESDLILSPRLDDLSCVYASLKAFLTAEENENSTPVFALFDNEEVGSETMQGAASSFLRDTLFMIAKGEGEYSRAIANSFIVSADNAHAKHPNHPELSDPDAAPILGSGVVIKRNANKRYSSDAVSVSVISLIAEKCQVPVETYYNRADMLGGTTLGAIVSSGISAPSVDIGIPQLAMHSANETCAKSDVLYMTELLRAFYSSALDITTDGISFL